MTMTTVGYGDYCNKLNYKILNLFFNINLFTKKLLAPKSPIETIFVITSMIIST